MSELRVTAGYQSIKTLENEFVVDPLKSATAMLVGGLGGTPLHGKSKFYLCFD